MTAPRLKTLRLCVTDLIAAKEFYGRFFGVPLLEEDRGYASFDLNGTKLEIVFADTQNPAGAGGNVGYFEVDSIPDAVMHAKTLGASVYRGPLKIHETGWTIVQIKDPGGNIIGLEGAGDAG